MILRLDSAGRVIRLTGEHLDRVTPLLESADEVVDPKRLGPKILANYADPQRTRDIVLNPRLLVEISRLFSQFEHPPDSRSLKARTKERSIPFLNFRVATDSGSIRCGRLR